MQRPPVRYREMEIQLVATSPKEATAIGGEIEKELADIVAITWEPTERCRRGWRLRGLIRPREDVEPAADNPLKFGDDFERGFAEKDKG